MDFSISGTGLLIALALVILPLLVLLSLLLILLWRMHHKMVSRLTNQNQDLWQKNQSLLNQLRAKDLPSLVSLQQVTGTQDSQSEQPYIPSHDEGVIYQQLMEESGNYVTEGIPDEFNAAGWESVVTTTNGSGPVRFAE